MALEEFDALVSRMPAIAAAVNAFQSETVQREAFVALISAFTGKASTAGEMPLKPPLPANNAVANANLAKEGRKGSGKKRRESGVAWSVIKDIDLAPPDKKSMETFISEKQPKSNEDRFPVAVYYLSEILGLPAVTISHVGTIFRLTPSWREPSDLAASLRVTASRKATIDPANLDDIKITPRGRNFVEHDLPEPAKKIK